MLVSDVLKVKGFDVKLVRADESIQTLAQRLTADKVGAMVVVTAAGDIEGIISERDVVRGLAAHGGKLVQMPVRDYMTKVVITCQPTDTVHAISKLMTDKRIRHVPVVTGGRLTGLVSIGDILNSRIDEVLLETSVLRDYTIALR